MRWKLLAPLLLLCVVSSAAAQEDCAPRISAALQSAVTSCAAVPRNFACYGNAPAEARARMGAAEPVFAQPADLADLNAVRRLTVSSNEAGWGVATMALQANLPDNPADENVTMVAFGDVVITNVGNQALTPTTFTATATTGANIRALPSDESAILDSLVAAETTQVVGRLSDSSWLQITLPDGLQATGWVFADLLRLDGDVNMLTVIDPNVPQYGPMQAIRFHSTLVDTGCDAAPQSGILIQTPRNAGRVLLSINNVNVRIGSTAFVQAIEGGLLTFHLLDGSALIDAEGGSVFIPAGTRATVQLNTDGLAAGAPSGPFPYDARAIANLPLQLLPNPIPMMPSLTQEQIETLRTTGELAPVPPPAGSTWTNAAGLVSDTCGGASTGATFPVTLTFDESGVLHYLAWNDLVFNLRSADSRYVDSVQFHDAQYALDLTLTSTTTYSAELTVTFEYSPGCAWRFHWDGSTG
ncbi:MAG: SH3 domain-containing protein [Anaerolineae bacterium]